MAHTLATLRARVKARIASTPGDTLLTDAQVNDFVNRALATLSLEQDWPWQHSVAYQVLAVGTSGFAVPTGWYRTESMTHIDSGQPLVRLAPKALDRIIGEGRPDCWATAGVSALMFRATADQNYTVAHRYMRVEPLLTLDTDVPLVPEHYSQAVVEWAAYQCLTEGNSSGRAAQAMVDYQLSLRRMRDNANQGSEPLRVTIRPGGHI